MKTIIDNIIRILLCIAPLFGRIRKNALAIRKYRGLSHVPPRPQIYVINQQELDKSLYESKVNIVFSSNADQMIDSLSKMRMQLAYLESIMSPEYRGKITNITTS